MYSLITGNEGKYLVSSYATTEFETSILETGSIKNLGNGNYFISRFFYRIWKYCLKNHHVKEMFIRIVRLFLFQTQNLIVVLMGPKFQRCFPYFFRNGIKAIYLFDAWPRYYSYITRFINDFSVDYVFISSSQSATVLNNLIEGNKVYWLPEGIRSGDYKYYNPDEKENDVISFGRLYKSYHQKIKHPLLKGDYKYIFSEDGQLIFPDKNSLVEGLARSKISICFPRNITHPESAGEIETMTIRYLQSMASKCLVLGKAPQEMIDLFGYNPVIEIDMENASAQIINILKNYKDYFDLIEKNYRTVIEKHTWAKRWQSINEIIQDIPNK